MNSSFAQAETAVITHDFRNTTWGMTRSEVKIAESLYPLSENETHINYRDKYMNLESIVSFHFINDSLVGAGYAFNEILTNPKSNNLNYEKVKLHLTSCYGVPVAEYSESKQSDGNIFIIEWKTQRSVIRLLFVSDKLSTEFGIIHISRKYQTSLAI